MTLSCWYFYEQKYVGDMLIAKLMDKNTIMDWIKTQIIILALDTTYYKHNS